MSAIHFRPQTVRKLIGAAVLTTGLLALYSYSTGTPLLLTNFQTPWSQKTCTPQAYSDGTWVYHPRTNATKMTDPKDAHAFSGFEACASSREYFWHLASDREDQWDRFPKAQSWQWVPGRGCEDMRPLDPAALVKDMVEDGGWYLVGDSVSENHFFSLSCILYPHVRAEPDWTLGGFDRAWPQYLYLKPDSPMIPYIKFPEGFNISTTPLVKFRRVDILLSKEQLIGIHSSIQPSGTELEDPSLFSDEAVWTMPPAEYLGEFNAPLPEGNYGTMIVSTAGHWTTNLFAKTSPPGIEGVINLFREAMKHWMDEVQMALWQSHKLRSAKMGASQRKRPRVIVRAYLPGHENCHDHREPWKTIQPWNNRWFNWADIWEFNDVFDKLTSDNKKYPDIHYLGIDRPARLRPDAHASGDCLHIMSGAGVLEGWSHYIWQYVTRELP
ncbi:hypothetical protein NLJ89_g7266 [Agrocybe chaxingu]|uniref:Uncharacterized protein n=1 Tax=Agrocybe chaxingu TaxID=84603 RepID=A0A9W8MV80_9AGAR|nr:hypothetical protein NLJ89_g7266 [Agrocybe chaxingu]